ncbi:UNKNOWN [Stylonychia lemnae]|uniref:Uncharacterized protein n=1 Tax=Stylonychia lemnae TaxID=5949 RepID=A0A078AGH4_STYLE|nr:UNKNOWN [Stylonychia lemnae]|eukprot:CDW79953.1 UNKNOWN [Stylonychia lemnae]
MKENNYQILPEISKVKRIQQEPPALSQNDVDSKYQSQNNFIDLKLDIQHFKTNRESLQDDPLKSMTQRSNQVLTRNNSEIKIKKINSKAIAQSDLVKNQFIGNLNAGINVEAFESIKSLMPYKNQGLHRGKGSVGNLHNLLSIGQNNNQDITKTFSTNNLHNKTQIIHRQQPSQQLSHRQNEDANLTKNSFNLNRIINQKTFVSSIISTYNLESLNQTKNTMDQSKLSLTARLDNSTAKEMPQKFSINNIKKMQAQYTRIFLQNIEDFFTVQKDKISHDERMVQSLENKIKNLELELEAYKKQDYDSGKIKMIPLREFKEKKEEYLKMFDDQEKVKAVLLSRISLLEIKCDRLQDIINETENKGSSHVQNLNQLMAQIQELNDQMASVQETAQIEFKNKDKLLIKMYEERTKNLNKVKQFKEKLELKDKVMGELTQREKEYTNKIQELQSKIVDLNQHADQRNIYIQELKNQLNKNLQMGNEKAQKMEELTTKLQELERAIRSGKFSKQNLDPIHFQVSLEGFMFKLFNDDPYALSNNIRLGLQLGNKNIHLSHAGLEHKVLVENSLHQNEQDSDHLGKYQIIDVNQINLQKFIYAKPKLSMLIENVISQKLQLIFEPPYEQWLFMTIRGILDSKYFEMVLNEDSYSFYKSSKFVGKILHLKFNLDFIYSWLGNFCVDKTSKMVRGLEFYEKDRADNLRLQLVLGFCLQDKLAVDEQCYYLHCRNMLFKGPHLKDTGSHQRMHLIDLDRVNEFVDHLFEKMPQEDTIKLKSRLKSLSRRAPVFKTEDDELDFGDIFGNKHNEKPKVMDYWQIDQGLVLRILLEYYRREKKIRILLLKRLFEEEPKDSFNNKGHICFAGFRKIMEQFDPSITEIDISRIYRDAFVAGNGVVNFDSAMVVFNEQNFFVRTLQIKGRNESPIVNHLNDIALPNNLTEDQIAQLPDEKVRDTQISAFIYDHWRNNESNFISIKRLIENAGQEALLNRFITLENFIKNKGQIDSAKVRGKSMIQVYRRFMTLMVCFRTMFLEVCEDDFSCFSSNQTKTLESIQREVNYFNEIFDWDNEMIVNLSRIPKGRDVTDEKRYWIHMQNLFCNGYHITKDSIKRNATLKMT